MVDFLRPPQQPSLPLPPADRYDPRYHEEYGRVLRLYFNQLNNILTALAGKFGGIYVDCPNGLFFDLGTYSPALANTGYPLEFKQTYLGHGISVVDDTKITVEYGGVQLPVQQCNYQYQFQPKNCLGLDCAQRYPGRVFH